MGSAGVGGEGLAEGAGVERVGTAVIGAEEGVAVGAKEGVAVGAKEGVAVGAKEGLAVGAKEGLAVGEVGAEVGAEDGLFVGTPVGAVGACVGACVEVPRSQCTRESELDATAYTFFPSGDTVTPKAPFRFVESTMFTWLVRAPVPRSRSQCTREPEM